MDLSGLWKSLTERGQRKKAKAREKFGLAWHIKPDRRTFPLWETIAHMERADGPNGQRLGKSGWVQ